MDEIDYLEMIKEKPWLFSNKNAPLKIETDSETIDAWSNRNRELLKQKGLPLAWAEIGVLVHDPYFTIIRDLVRFPDGSMNGYSRVIGTNLDEVGKAIVVLPIHQKKVLILHQYRHPTRSWHYEVPRGVGEANISAVDNAHKEINEEIQGEIEELIDLGELHSNTGFEGSSVSLFLAKLSSVGNPNRNEGIDEILWVPVATIEDWIRIEKITDGFTIAAYSRAKLRKLI